MSSTPDIEIYIKCKDLTKIQHCLEQIFEQSLTFHSAPPFQRTDIGNIPVKVYLNVKSGFSSIWFDSEQTPWETDLDCAVAIQHQSGMLCRCVKAGWIDGEEEDPDLWLEINKQGHKELIWR